MTPLVSETGISIIKKVRSVWCSLSTAGVHAYQIFQVSKVSLKLTQMKSHIFTLAPLSVRLEAMECFSLVLFISGMTWKDGFSGFVLPWCPH
jgi:hypothetical protein